MLRAAGRQGHLYFAAGGADASDGVRAIFHERPGSLITTVSMMVRLVFVLNTLTSMHLHLVRTLPAQLLHLSSTCVSPPMPSVWRGSAPRDPSAEIKCEACHLLGWENLFVDEQPLGRACTHENAGQSVARKPRL